MKELPNDYSRCANFTCPYANTCLRIIPPKDQDYYYISFFQCTEEKEEYISEKDFEIRK